MERTGEGVERGRGGRIIMGKQEALFPECVGYKSKHNYSFY